MQYRQWWNNLRHSIRTKLVIPYVVLSLVVAILGAYVVLRLVAGTLQERFDNQLIDAGRIAAESMVEHEQERLAVLRTITFTEGVAEAVANEDEIQLGNLVPQIITNSNSDLVAVLNRDGIELFGAQRSPGTVDFIFSSDADYSAFEDVQLVLNGFVDDTGDKRAFLAETPETKTIVLLTVGPIYNADELVGAVLVGSNVNLMVRDLTEDAVARVTLYDRNGGVVATTLGVGAQTINALQEDSSRYEEVISGLRQSTEDVEVLVSDVENQVPLREVEVLGQLYQVAFGEWRLRGQSFGLFSVALPKNFITTTTIDSRNLLILIFALGTVGVMIVGLYLAYIILTPILRLVRVSRAVAQGDLDQRTQLDRKDELGDLSRSFDHMTDQLVKRNREFAEQASNLEAILQSIADGVLVFDTLNRIILSNAAAEKILSYIREQQDMVGLPSPNGSVSIGFETVEVIDLPEILTSDEDTIVPQRFELAGQVYSALSATVYDPNNNKIGRVVVLRDITRETEAERVKDNFIKNISHELRTPLTSIKGYINLLLMNEPEKLTPKQEQLLNVADENSNRLIERVNQLIELSELQAGTLKLSTRREDFAQLVKNITANWEDRMAEKNIDFFLDIEGQFFGQEMWIKGDPQRLMWVINNLLQNAYNYTPENGRIEVRVTLRDGAVHFEVSDSGIGIKEEDQPYLFSRFFRIANDPPFDVRGMGLGLFIVRALVEAHGGHVWADSKYGTGSRFGFALPLFEGFLV